MLSLHKEYMGLALEILSAPTLGPPRESMLGLQGAFKRAAMAMGSYTAFVCSASHVGCRL